MLVVPCAIGWFFVVLSAVRLEDHRLAHADRPAWSLRECGERRPVCPRPAIAPLIPAIGSQSYSALYAAAGLCAIIGAFAILRVRRVRWACSAERGEGRGEGGTASEPGSTTGWEWSGERT